uniref:Integrin beta n=2 Tax=Leptobrachium leishanense TaxID=445787 RepID=A0A8C5M6C8_9ANUR
MVGGGEGVQNNAGGVDHIEGFPGSVAESVCKRCRDKGCALLTPLSLALTDHPPYTSICRQECIHSPTVPQECLLQEMSWGIIFLLLQAGILITTSDGAEVCNKLKVGNCQECIQSGPACAWCKKVNFTNAGEQDSARCDVLEILTSRNCSREDIIHPRSQIESQNSKALSDKIQLSPSDIFLKLRPGQTQEFQVKFRRAEGYPVDLYYLMDLSYSMGDDLQNVKKLGSELLKALNSITKSARIGFGSFVDKTVLPFVSTHPENLKNPCPEKKKNVECQPPFSFKHILNLTEDGKQFEDQVGKQQISGNIDAPEGGLDAMMQVAVCGDKIGWRNVTRLLVYATDDGFHIAGDGKLAAILTPNDGRCHLENNMYTKSNMFDYPSVGQLAMKLSENNIQAVFAVTSNIVNTYKALNELIPKSVVGVLSGNSSNVVQLITDAYQNLSSEVILSHGSTPEFLDILYDSFCPDSDVKTDQLEGRCTNVKINQEISFKVKVKATRCLPGQSFVIRPLGFTDTLTVGISTLCDCECNDVPQTRECSSNGKAVCGICSCKEGHVGKNCECRTGGKTSQELEQSCRKDNNSAVCSGLGDCICGQCYCHQNTEDPTKVVSGQYCECDNYNCELSDGKICGGQGFCKCGQCICNEEFEGTACQCRKSTTNCVNARGSVCSGRGTCRCNRCECKSGYLQPFCEQCPGCPSRCQSFRDCVECLIPSKDGNTANCSSFCIGVTPTRTVKLQEETFCREKDANNCWMQYVIKEEDGENKFSITYSEKTECPEAPNVIAIVGGTIAGVIAIGLLCLILWKIIVEVNDRKAYKRFEQETAKAKWNKVANPLFQPSTTTVMNPQFHGE